MFSSLLSSDQGMVIKEAHILDLPNELLEILCREIVILDHLWKH